MKVIHTYAEPATGRGTPGFVSIDALPDGRHVLTVLERENVVVGSHTPAKIEMTPKQLAAMALDILDHFNVLDLT